MAVWFGLVGFFSLPHGAQVSRPKPDKQCECAHQPNESPKSLKVPLYYFFLSKEQVVIQLAYAYSSLCRGY